MVSCSIDIDYPLFLHICERLIFLVSQTLDRLISLLLHLFHLSDEGVTFFFLKNLLLLSGQSILGCFAKTWSSSRGWTFCLQLFELTMVIGVIESRVFELFLLLWYFTLLLLDFKLQLFYCVQEFDVLFVFLEYLEVKHVDFIGLILKSAPSLVQFALFSPY